MTVAAASILAAAITALAAAGATLWTRRKAGPDAAAAMMTASTLFMTQLQNRVVALEAQVVSLHAELEEAKRESHRGERSALKLTVPSNVPVRTMDAFINDGWLQILNDAIAASGLGVRVGLYLDDVDQDVALGYLIEPSDINNQQAIPPSTVAKIRRDRAAEVAEEVRESPDE